MDKTTEDVLSFRHEEYRFQRMSDSAKIAQRSVETLANLVNELIEAISIDLPETAKQAEYRLSKIPHLRKVPLREGRNDECCYIMELPFPLSPVEAEQENYELEYLRKLQEAKHWGPWVR